MLDKCKRAINSLLVVIYKTIHNINDKYNSFRYCDCCWVYFLGMVLYSFQHTVNYKIKITFYSAHLSNHIIGQKSNNFHYLLDYVIKKVTYKVTIYVSRVVSEDPTLKTFISFYLVSCKSPINILCNNPNIDNKETGWRTLWAKYYATRDEVVPRTKCPCEASLGFVP